MERLNWSLLKGFPCASMASLCRRLLDGLLRHVQRLHRPATGATRDRAWPRSSAGSEHPPSKRNVARSSRAGVANCIAIAYCHDPIPKTFSLQAVGDVEQ